MAYTPYYPGGWQSGEQGGTPITPAALNNMEAGIGAALTSGDVVNNLTSTATDKPGSANMLRVLNGYFPTWKRMSGTATVAAGGGNVDVGEFPPLAQNSRLVLGMSTSSSSVIPVGWVITSANKLNIIVRNISSASIEATLTCVAIYLPDAKAWS